MRVPRSNVGLVALLLLVAAGASSAAEFRPRVSAAPGGAVSVNRRAALRFRVPNGSLSQSERAAITADRLAQMVGQGASPYLILAKGNKLQARVLWGDRPICIVTRLDARQARTSPLALAGAWAAQIRGLLLMPPIVLSDRQVTVPLGEVRRVFVTGAAVGPMATSSDNAAVVSAAAGEGRYVTVTGLAVGRATVTVEVEGQTESFSVYVKKYAGGTPSNGMAEVTGSPCPSSIVTYAAMQAVLRSVMVEPGADVSIEKIEGADNPLPAGTARDVKVSVAIRGEGYLDYRGTIAVKVRDAAMPADDAAQLFYSNNPERLLKYQTLFAAYVDPNQPTRLLYHHQNAMGKRAHLLVELVNPTDQPAVFRMTRAVAAPLVDTVLVGYIASSSFLKSLFYNASVIEHLPPQSRLVLVSDTLANMETASGIIQVKQTVGSGAYMRVAALPPGLDNARVGQITPAPPPGEFAASDHIYAKPVKAIEAAYTVGQRWAFIPIGRHAIGSNNAQRKLDGNYGVTYDISVNVDNPTDSEKKILVLFEPSAGLASGVFIVDGQFVSTKYAKPPHEVPLKSFKLRPGQTKMVRIQTLPVAGSNYPATVIVRS